MIIQAEAILATIMSKEELHELAPGSSIDLTLVPDKGVAMDVTVYISATDIRKKLVRIEGYTTYKGKKANVIMHIFSEPDMRNEAYAELTIYPNQPRLT